MLDKIIIKTLERQGITKADYYRFKLYNPISYDKMISQAEISQGLAVAKYKDKIKGVR